MPLKATKQIEVKRLILFGLTIKEIAKELSMQPHAVYKARDKLLSKGILIRNNEGIITESTGHLDGVNTSLIAPEQGELFHPIRNNWIRYHNIQVTIGILKPLPLGWLNQQNGIFYRNADKTFGQTKYINLNQQEMSGRIYRHSVVLTLPEITKATLEEAEAESMNIIKRTIRLIEERYKITLLRDGYLNMRLNKGHYALIHNELAQTYKDKKETLKIYWKDGKLRLTIDFSRNALEGARSPELEATHPQLAHDDASNIKQFWEEYLDNPFMPKDVEVLRKQNQLMMGVQEAYAENIKKHLRVMEHIDKTLDDIKKVATYSPTRQQALKEIKEEQGKDFREKEKIKDLRRWIK